MRGGEDVLRIVYAALYAGVVGVAGVVAQVAVGRHVGDDGPLHVAFYRCAPCGRECAVRGDGHLVVEGVEQGVVGYAVGLVYHSAVGERAVVVLYAGGEVVVGDEVAGAAHERGEGDVALLVNGLNVRYLHEPVAYVHYERCERAVFDAADLALYGRYGYASAHYAHAGVGAVGQGVAHYYAYAVILRGGERFELRGVAGEAVALHERENGGVQLVGSPLAQSLRLSHAGSDVGIEAVVGGDGVVVGRGLECQQTAQFAVRGLQERFGTLGVVFVEYRGEGVRVGEAHEPQLGAVARFGIEVLDVAVEVGVVLLGHAKRLQSRELLDRIGLAEFEIVVALDLFGAYRQKSQATVGHSLDLAESAIGEIDFYSW